ncbi:hypothetical protein CEP52_010360 [Fusarium oligoseptatum]|uniref:Uncharacterized protein n=1 Tax=Fusarium oligoseptatum TaxID=2604345 RepID=A0A428T8J4_9HYPO|nr:hypothetical protein CEP52_010360 [Fusarium oligoseptatum]
MWIIAEDAPTLHDLSFSNSKYGFIKDGKLKEPVVSFNGKTKDPPLYYLLTFESGTMTLATQSSGFKSLSENLGRLGQHSDPSGGCWPSDSDYDDLFDRKDFDIAGWTLAFPVKIASKEVRSGDDKFDAYIERMSLQAGDFTLAQLLIDMSQSKTLCRTLSSFGAEEWDKETDTVQHNFELFIEDWLTDMKNKDRTVIGVSIKAGNPEDAVTSALLISIITEVNKNAPTFPPTSCDYLVYPWLEPGSSSQPEDGLEENALCLALMTGGTSPPSPVGLPYSGTFVNATENHAGTLCMNSSIFWDKWLLLLVQQLNAVTEIYPTTPYAKANSDGSVAVAPCFYVGYNPDHPDTGDTYFRFTDKMSYGLLYFQCMPYFQWTGSYLESSAEDSSNAGAWLHHIEVKQSGK